MNELFRHASKNPLIPADTDLLPHADLALIYGNKFIISELAQAAAQLYKSGTTSTIVATGGVPVNEKHTEAEALYTELRSLGVPSRAILLENQSTNTEENITLAKYILDSKLGLENISSVIGLGHALAGPRFIMSLARHWPSVLPMHISVFPQDINPTNWLHNPEFLSRAFHDAAKLPFYGQMNYVAPVLPHHVNQMIADHHALESASLSLKAS